MQAALLPDRGVVKVAGDDARHFLNGLVTTDMGKVAPGRARFAALLTPQGKIIVDFIVAEAPGEDGRGFLADLTFEFRIQRANVRDGFLTGRFKTSQFQRNFVWLERYTIWGDEDLVNTVGRADRDSR